MSEFQYEVQKINDTAFMVSEGFTTMFVLAGETQTLLIDCGLGVGDFQALVKTLAGDAPVTLAATHAHVDHIGGRGQFDEMAISAPEAALIRTCGASQRRRWLRRKQLTEHVTKEIRIRDEKKEPRVRIIKEGDTFDLGGGRIVEVMETPGHTKGSLSFYDRQQKILYAGDTVSSYLFLWLPHTATVEATLQSFYRMRSLDFELIWPCHHRRPFDRARFDGLVETLEQLAQKKNTRLPLVKKFVRNGNRVFYRTSLVREKN